KESAFSATTASRSRQRAFSGRMSTAIPAPRGCRAPWTEPSMYVPLWCKTNFSFLEGASHPEELVETAAHLGLPAIAVTDRNGVYGMVRAFDAARRSGIKLITGSQVSIDGGSSVVLLARDRAGYGSLCRLISRGHLRNPKGTCTVTWAEVAESARGLHALWLNDPANHALRESGLGILKEAFGE